MLTSIKLPIFDKIKPVQMPKNNGIQSFVCNYSIKSDSFERKIPINFTGVDNSAKGKAIRELKNTPCPCCGDLMLDGKTFFNLNPNLFNQESFIAIENLMPYEKYMHKVEKDTFNIMKKLSAENPEKNLRELLDLIRPEHIEDIKTEELRIIEKIKTKTDEITEEKVKNKLNAHLEKSKQIIEEQNPNFIFSRRVFVRKSRNILKNMENKDLENEILSLCKTMPKSSSCISAFVIKYSEKNALTKREQTSFDIVKGLLRPSVGSVEHIKARHPKDKNQKAGANKISNYLYECIRCNSEKVNTPLKNWIEEHPEMINNIQSYIDKVIQYINNGGMKNFKTYPIEVRETLLKESEGKINLDINKLRI